MLDLGAQKARAVSRMRLKPTKSFGFFGEQRSLLAAIDERIRQVALDDLSPSSGATLSSDHVTCLDISEFSFRQTEAFSHAREKLFFTRMQDPV